MAVYQWRAGDQKGYLNASLQLDPGCWIAEHTAAGPRPKADIHTIGCHQMELHSCKGIEYLFIFVVFTLFKIQHLTMI